jgi:hypothetical protein
MTRLIKYERGEWDALKEQASILVKSGLLPRAIDTAEKALAIMMQGRELGIGTMQALNGINVIQGKATISPQLMLALIFSSGKLHNYEIDNQQTCCTVTMWRVGMSPHSEKFSMDDARSMGLLDKDNWKKQPSTMLKWRAISACARIVFPDVIIGMYMPEEIAPELSVDPETGEIVAVEAAAEMPCEALQSPVSALDSDHTETIHWIANPTVRARFWIYCKELGLTNDEVHEALEVAHIVEFSGSMAEAKAILDDYASSKKQYGD